jgi:hypothetical protein
MTGRHSKTLLFVFLCQELILLGVAGVAFNRPVPGKAATLAFLAAVVADTALLAIRGRKDGEIKVWPVICLAAIAVLSVSAGGFLLIIAGG